jgi:hypothetical protein
MALNELKDTKGEVKRLQLHCKKVELQKEAEKKRHAEMVKHKEKIKFMNKGKLLQEAFALEREKLREQYERVAQ